MPPKIHKPKPANDVSRETNNDDLSLRENVLVCVRMRPLNRRERKKHEKVAWKLEENQISQCSMATSEGLAPKSYSYDELWGPEIRNVDIFLKIGISVIKATMEGYHGVVFAYGQTSSGKTYSIHGSEQDPGIIPRAVQAMFEYIENTSDRDFLIQVSYLEIYNEVIKDLIHCTGESLDIREDPRKGIFVQGLQRTTVMCTEQIYALLAQGESHRHICKTNYNDVSSRSHTIFQIMVESQSNGIKDKAVLESKLNLVDLAGSEDTAKAGLEKKAETGNINKSLLALASVIWKISEPKGKGQRHIPYRNSKLTRVLQESLNGSACISVICCLSPSSGNIDESISTLKFANRAKNIKNTAKQNVKKADDKTLIAKYKAEIEELKQLLLKNAQQPAGIVAANISPSKVSPSALEEQLMRKDLEKQELENKIEHLNKVILRSHFQNNVPPDQLLSGNSTRKPNCRRPSYFNMGSTLGPSTFSGPRRRQSAFTLGNSFAVMENPAGSDVRPKNKRMLRSGSLGLCDETGNDEIDDLLCLPARVQVHFEKEKSKQMEIKLSEKSGEVAQLYHIIEEKNGIIEEKNGIIEEKEHEICQLEEDIEDQRQEMKTKEYENETYLQTIREYEEKLLEYDKEKETGKVVPIVKKKPIQTTEIKSFKLVSGIRSTRKAGFDSGPLIGFFLKNMTTGSFEYEGRTEWVKGRSDPIFNREFSIKNIPSLVMRFSVYDVYNEQQIDQGDFIGSTTLELRTLLHQFDTKNDDFVDYELETENSKEKAWLRVKIQPNNTNQKKQKRREKKSLEIKELKKQVEGLIRENEKLKKINSQR